MKGQKKGKLTLEYVFLLNGFSFTLSKNRNNAYILNRYRTIHSKTETLN